MKQVYGAMLWFLTFERLPKHVYFIITSKLKEEQHDEAGGKGGARVRKKM